MIDMTLDEVNIGETVEIIGYSNISNNLKTKILALGLIKGTEIRMINVAPLGDPIEISVRGYSLSLRKDEARYIKVKLLTN